MFERQALYRDSMTANVYNECDVKVRDWKEKRRHTRRKLYFMGE